MKSITYILLSCFALTLGCTEKTGSGKNMVFNENDLKVTWALISNFAGERRTASASFTIENDSKYLLTDTGWAMFFNQFDVNFRKGTESAPVTLMNLGGDFCRLSPKKGFQLKPGQSIIVTYEVSGSMIKKTDAPQGVYFVFYDGKGGEYQRMSLKNYVIAPFTKPEQVNRSKRDQVPIPTAQFLFNEYKSTSVAEAKNLPPFLPVPNSYSIRQGNIILNNASVIHFEKGLEQESAYLMGYLEKLMGSRLKSEQSGSPGKGMITLKTGTITVNSVKNDAYTIEASPDKGIIITGTDSKGVFYGVVSLLNMLPVTAFKNPENELSIRAISVKDAPAFQYRGMHLDVARDFSKKETVLKLIDVMAFYKLNRLHFHITDDEGWRLEIKGLPELTGLGSKRGHTLTDEEYLHPSYGSGPEPDPSVSFGTGFYSRQEYKEIIKYAYERQINVIPEIEMPGHARAAIKSMESRYRKLMAAGKKNEAEFYRLVDPDDKSEYTSAQNYRDNVVCVVREGVYNFYSTVLNDIIDIYKEAGVPLVMWHVAGDEVPSGSWEKSPLCQEFLKTNPGIKTAKDLQPFFFGRIIKMINEKNLPIGGWEEMAMKPTGEGNWIPNPAFAGKQIYPFVWNSLRENMDLGYKLANGGYPVILCNVTNFYFDMAYNKDPREPGLYWGGFCDTKDAFRFVPYDLFQSVVDDPNGDKITDQEIQKMEKLKPAARKNIIGLQGQIWSETIKGQEMLEYDYLPKMLGLANCAWNGDPSWAYAKPGDRENLFGQAWNIFVNQCSQREFPRLDYLSGGYNFRVSPPGIDIVDGKIAANTEFPGMTIRYTTDGSEPDESSAKYQEPFEAKGLIKMKTFSEKGRGSLTSELEVK